MISLHRSLSFVTSYFELPSLHVFISFFSLDARAVVGPSEEAFQGGRGENQRGQAEQGA